MSQIVEVKEELSIRLAADGSPNSYSLKVTEYETDAEGEKIRSLGVKDRKPTLEEINAILNTDAATMTALTVERDALQAERDALKVERDALDLKVNPPQFVLTARSLTAVLTVLGKWDEAVTALNAVDSRIMPNLIQVDRVDLTLPPADTLLPQLNLTKEEIMAHDLAVART